MRKEEEIERDSKWEGIKLDKVGQQRIIQQAESDNNVT